MFCRNYLIMKEKITKKIAELKEAAETKTGNQQFDCGFNIATYRTITFLTNLLDNVDAKDAEIEMLRGKLEGARPSGKQYKNVTEMFLDR